MTCQFQPPSMEEVYNDYFSAAYNYVFYKLLNRENTEDIVSQVFLKVLSHLNAYDPSKASLKTWIFRITDHTLVDFYRKQRPGVSFDHEETGLENVLFVSFEEQYDQELAPERQAVFAALRQLPERERTFIYYRYYLNISNREIARRMNMNENTVSAIMARARKKLKGIVAEDL